MNLLQDVITYMRRIIKTPSNASVTDDLLIDYINRFIINDVDAIMQLFDYKTKFQFMTRPGVDQYNMPLYDLQIEPGNQTISYYPVYQGFTGSCFINGIPVHFEQLQSRFKTYWPNYIQYQYTVAVGDGTIGPYTLSVPFQAGQPFSATVPLASCIIRGHVDISGVIALATSIGSKSDPIIGAVDGSTIPIVPTTSVNSTVYFTSSDAQGNNVVIADSGQFLAADVNAGLLMVPGSAPLGNTSLVGAINTDPYSTTQNTFNYFTGVAQNVYFPVAIPEGNPINASCYYYQLGLPRSIGYYNNVITLRSPPNTQYLVEMDAYLTPAAYLSNESAVSFGYMSEFIARGAVRKILSDTGDWDQFNAYEGLYNEQKMLVWKRSQRQFTATRTPTIYSSGGAGLGGYPSSYGIGN